MNNYSLQSEDYNVKLNAELDSAPTQLGNAIFHLSKGDIENCINILKTLLPEFENRGDYWTGAAYSCYAYCLMQLGYWKEAIHKAKKANEFGLNLVGYWYYFDVMVNALNYIDEVHEALINANEAIDYYRKRHSMQNVAYFLSTKANILKQLASQSSREFNTYSTAKEFTTEAIDSLVESYSLFPGDSKESQAEFLALSTIAARVGITETDLIHLHNYHNVQNLISQYFTNRILIPASVTENFNKAVDSTQNKDRAIASKYFEFAYERALEDTEEDRAFKVLLCYQYGVCLLFLSRLDKYRPGQQLNPDQMFTAKKIKSIWEHARRLYSRLSKDKIEDFNNRMSPGITSAIDNIEKDVLFNSTILY